MKRQAVFFDRDNTLIVTNDYLGEPSRVRLYDGATDAVARAHRLGYVVVVFSNQSGVARGMYSEDDVRKVNARLDELLLEGDATAIVDRHEFCPDHPNGAVEPYNRESPRRKPAPGMLFDAARALDIDLQLSWTIGDAPRDVEAGKRAGCRTVLMKDSLVPASLAATERLTVEPDYIAANLEDAMDFVEMHRTAAPVEEGEAIIDEHSVPAELHSLIDVPQVLAVGNAQQFADQVSLKESDEDADPPEESAANAPESVDTSGIESAGRTARPIMPYLTAPVSMPILASSSTEIPAASQASTQAASHASMLSGGSLSADKVVMDPLIKELKTLQRQQTQIIDELRHLSDKPQDFSVARLLAGIMLGFSIAAMFGAWLYKDSTATHMSLILVAIWLQVGVASLMLMSSK